MNFNAEQTKQIGQFIMDYNTNEEYRLEVQEEYDKEARELSILYIYALEEVLRYGSSGFYQKFLEAKGDMEEAEAAKTFDQFIDLLASDDAFMQYKREQLLSSPETLSPIEVLALEIVTLPERQEENKKEEADEEYQEAESETLHYDPLNPIKSATDDQIRETLENLLFGEYIMRVLNTPIMADIKGRCNGGQIASQDKQYIIEKIRVYTSNDEFPLQLKTQVDNRYVRVKMNLLLGKSQEEAFAEYLPYNTNISSREILGIKRNNSEEAAYEFFKEFLKNRGK